jgi:hypothetical protein
MADERRDGESVWDASCAYCFYFEPHSRNEDGTVRHESLSAIQSRRQS